MLLRALLFCIVLFISGCGKSLTTEINNRFPPVTVDQQRQSAIDTNATALDALLTPNLAIGLKFSDLNEFILSDDLKKSGVKKVQITGDQELMKIELSFDRQFDGSEGEKSPDLVSLLKSLKPSVSGSAVFYAGITGAVTTVHDGEIPNLDLRVLPVVSTIKVDKLTLAEKFDETKITDVLVSILNSYKDNLSGELTRNPATSVSVPALSNKPYDMSGPIQIKGTGLRGVAVVSMHPVTAPFKLDGVAWLIASNNLTALIQLTPVSQSRPVSSQKIGHTYSEIEKRMAQVVSTDFQVANADSQTWVAVKKDVISYAANVLSAQAGACVTASIGGQAQHVSQKIPMPNGAGIDCSKPTSCDAPLHCTFDANHDTRDCHHWYGNDPICEAAKALQNAAYNTDANVRKANCDATNAAAVAGCQTRVAGEIALCQTKKQALDALGHTGNFANLDVDARVATNNMNVCLRDFTLSPDLNHLQFALNVEGSASAHVDLKFVPLDAGHIVCAADWSKSQDFIATLRENRINISASSVVVTDTNGTHADFTVDKLDVKAKMSPGLTEFLLTSPDLLIKCPLLAYTAPTLVALTPFIPALEGDVDYSLPEQKASFQLPMTSQKVAGHDVAITVAQTKPAIVLSVISITKAEERKSADSSEMHQAAVGK